MSGQAGAAAAQPLDGATVELRTPTVAGSAADRQQTDARRGAFTLTGIADGSYSLVVSAAGYGHHDSDRHARAGQQYSVDIVLYTSRAPGHGDAHLARRTST